MKGWSRESSFVGTSPAIKRLQEIWKTFPVVVGVTGVMVVAIEEDLGFKR